MADGTIGESVSLVDVVPKHKSLIDACRENKQDRISVEILEQRNLRRRRS